MTQLKEMNCPKLSPSTTRVLRFLERHFATSDTPPTRQAIAAGAVVSPPTLAHVMAVLDARGYIEWVPGKYKYLRWLGKQDEANG